MLTHDDIVVRYCKVLGRAGYRVFVKDHPLQFGFRQRELFERLARLPFVVLVPYDVPANLLIGKCAVSVTFTGTIGFQAALAGLCSVATEPYYATEQHFLHVRDTNEVDAIVEQLARWRPPDDLDTTRRANHAAPCVDQRGGRLFRLAQIRSRERGAARLGRAASAFAECPPAAIPEILQNRRLTLQRGARLQAMSTANGDGTA